MTESRWSAERAWDWYRRRPWPVGSNFIPSTAINQLEMWQSETFDPDTIRRELGWGHDIGFNAAHVFLHHLLWQDDPDGFLARVDRFLEIAAANAISVMFVLFDGVWNPRASLGKQSAPRPRVHNSGWVQSPGVEILADPSRHDELRSYVQGVAGHFRDDARILAWDLFNEPDNPNIGTYSDLAPERKAQMAEQLLAKAFLWAREAGPRQPLTAGVWRGTVSGEGVSAINQLMLGESDVISFHSYRDAATVAKRIDDLSLYERPILLTEFMSRTSGSTFEGILPLAKERGVGAFCWGLVAGKTQTIYPWDSWARTYDSEPDPWFHDVLRSNGSPYRQEEVDLVRRLSAGREL